MGKDPPGREPLTGFRGLSVRPKAGEQPGETRLPHVNRKVKEGKRRKVKQKRIHLVRNPLVCEQCLKFWPESQFKGNEKKLFTQVKDGPFRHRGCPGAVRPYYDLSRAVLVRLSIEKLFADVGYRDFFPSMGNLVRDDMPDLSHHNCECTGTCCVTGKGGSHGPEPTDSAVVTFTSNFPTLAGWEEQAHKTCAAASVAGALNGALRLCCDPNDSLSLQRAPSPEGGGGAPRSRPLGIAEKNVEGDGCGRILEQDVIEYYCKWSREAGQIGCHAALRGSCGLIPSTRKIGNPRLLRACHAVGTSFVSDEVDRHRRASEGIMDSRSSAGGIVCLPQVGCTGAVASDEEESDDTDSNDDDGSSPVETLRLMGNWMCRDRIEDGGRCSPDDGDEVEEAQWLRVKEELAGGAAVLLHFRNHYALVFAAREWRCEATGMWRRHLLTATQKQRPHVWFCFRQLRADMVYSKVRRPSLL